MAMVLLEVAKAWAPAMHLSGVAQRLRGSPIALQRRPAARFCSRRVSGVHMTITASDKAVETVDPATLDLAMKVARTKSTPCIVMLL